MIPSTPDGETSPPSDVVLSAVADDHRRAVLRSLDRSDEAGLTVDTLVEAVARRIGTGSRPAPDRRRRVRIALHHVHLPKLAAWGMIDYDTEAKQVRSKTGELSRELLSVLEAYETPN